MERKTEENNKKLVLEAFDTLFNRRDYVAAERFWSPHYIQHSARIEPGREGLFNLIKGAPSTLKYEPGCVSAYTSLVGDGGVNPGSLSVLGDSAGGNLALAVTVAARDRRLPLPARVAMISPFADLSFSGASIEQRRDLDPYVTRALLESMAADYLGDSDPADHRCSAVFADLNGLPPLLIQVGETEIL